MVRDVALRCAAQIDLLQPVLRALQEALCARRLFDIAAALPRCVAPDECNEIHDVAALNDDAPVDIGFGHAEPGMSGNVRRHIIVGQPHH